MSRLRRAADFERVLAVRPCERSTHFALHHLPAVELSTPADGMAKPAVDDIGSFGLTLGLVVPKRHARRAVTRALIKRSMRHAVLRWQNRMQQGFWVLRLKAPFAPARYRSAASRPLQTALGAELDALLASLAPR